MNDLPPARKEGQDNYEYTVTPGAVETFTNLMRREGVITAREGEQIVFTSNRLLDMRRLKKAGIIRSYVIVKLELNRQVVEKG